MTSSILALSAFGQPFYLAGFDGVAGEADTSSSLIPLLNAAPTTDIHKQLNLPSFAIPFSVLYVMYTKG